MSEYQACYEELCRVQAALALEKSKTAKMREALKKIMNLPLHNIIPPSDCSEIAKEALAESDTGGSK